MKTFFLVLFLYTDLPKFHLRGHFMIYFLSYINKICSIYWMSPNIGSIGCQRIARIPPTPALSLSRSSLDDFCLNYVAVLLLLVSAVSNCFCFPFGHLKTCNITVTYFHKKENQTYTAVVLCHVTLLPQPPSSSSLPAVCQVSYLVPVYALLGLSTRGQ